MGPSPPLIKEPTDGLGETVSLTNVAVPTPAEVHAHYGNQEANTLMTTPAVPTEKSFPKLLFMPNHWAPYFMAAQTPYQAFCTWQTLLATMSVQADRDDVGIPILNWFGAACARAGNGNVQRTRSSLTIEWGSVLPDQSLLHWATKRLALFRLPLPLQQPYSSSGRSNVGQMGWRGLGARELDLLFSRMTKTMRRDSNPAPRPELALPVSCITAAAAARFQNGVTRKQEAVADLITVAFFFLL